MFGITVRFVRFLRNVALCVAMAVMTMPAMACPEPGGLTYHNTCDNQTFDANWCGDEGIFAANTTFTCGDKVFVGWNTQADGKGKNYQPGDKIPAELSSLDVYAQWLAVSPMVNVKYIHQAIAAKWGINIAYHPNLKNERAAANMRYLMGMIDVANKRLGGTDKRYGDSIYATSYAASKNTVDKAVATLIKPKPKTFPFTATTTSSTSSFSFSISAAGEFWVDWGDGSDVETITKTDTNNQTISHTYTTAGTYDIKIGGLVTKYLTYLGAISFKSNTNLAGISGSLGAIFPTLANGSQPIFYATFSSCTNLTGSIPENLFAGISGAPAYQMFSSTFYGCTGLTGEIPGNLFAGVKGAPARDMFYGTFSGCTGLTSIPEGLFAGISGAPASCMFLDTFKNCTGLTSIPEGLFAGISGTPANYMFQQTFYNCSGLTGSIPAGLFGNLSGAPASNMFSSTFSGCSGLTGEIPSGLFGELSGAPAYSMFGGTFYGCTGLTGEIPLGLFGNLSGTLQNNMFTHTFNGCGGLTGKSARNPDGTYLYNAFASATSSQVGSMYSGTCLYDNASIPSAWGPNNSCTYPEPIPFDEMKFPFTITTTSDTTSFGFYIAAAGTFYVDWGDRSAVQTITRTATDQDYITHTYDDYNPDTYNIKIGGKATAYDDSYATIRFDLVERTAKISGSLGAIFPTLADGSQPRFYQTFYQNTNLTSLPEGLFTGIKGAPTDSMFGETFAECENLTGEIPLGFFGDLSGAPANYMFGDTFMGCSGLTGPSARNPDGTYLYNVFPSATSDEVGGMYSDTTELSDYDDIPSDWK